jgi:hypothetical protein
MKHFHQAYQDAAASLKDAALLAQVEKVCLIVDLEGRFRVLAKPADQSDPAALASLIEEKLNIAAGAFSTGETWLDSADSTKADKALFETVWNEAEADAAEPKLHVLHRRVSKDSWFAKNAEPPWPLIEGSTPPILSFYSYKGGVGRTTALASIAIQLARAGKRVLAIDFDLEAPGLGSIFPPPGGVTPEIGVVDYLMEHPVCGATFPIGDLSYIFDDPAVVGDGGGEIHVVHAGVVDANYLETLARINYSRISTGDQPPLPDLLKQLRTTIHPDVVLIDSRAGLHDIGGLALSPLVHRHILFGLDSEQSWRGLQFAVRHLGAERVMRDLEQQECVIVHCMAPARLDAVREASVQRYLERSYEVFSADYYDDPNAANPVIPVPDMMLPDKPHTPIVLSHTEAVMGYQSVTEVADALCSSEFTSLRQRVLPD